MPRFKVEMLRVEYLRANLVVEADTEKETEERAYEDVTYDLYEVVSADESVECVEELDEGGK